MLKNDGDGRSEMRFINSIKRELSQKERMQVFKLSPLVGESVNRQVDERGKCEQKRKDGNECEKKRKNGKNEWQKCGRRGKESLYGEQHFSIYGKIII